MASHILLLDTANLMHRARSGFGEGNHYIVYNFFRGLRPLVEKFKPDSVTAVMEGHPRKRHALQADYKGTRTYLSDLDGSDPRRPELESFHRQRRVIKNLLEVMPINVMRHPDHEADDVIMHEAVRVAADGGRATIISSDSDFIQVLQEPLPGQIQLYSPVKKKVVSAPAYDYVTWKSLVGDGSDNIAGVRGIGDKTAQKLMANGCLHEELQRRGGTDAYHHSRALIERHKFTAPEVYGIQYLSTDSDGSWDRLRNEFQQLGFQSMVKDRPWKKYVDTFPGA